MTTTSAGDLNETAVFKLSDELARAMAALRPIWATFKGVPGHDGEWDDMSPTGAEEARALFQGYLERTRSLPEPSGPWERLAGLVVKDALEVEIAQVEEADPLSFLNSIASAFQSLRMVFDCMDMSSAAGWEAIAARLETLDRAAAGLRESLEVGRREGRVVSARQARAGIREARAHAGEGSFFASLPARFAASGVGSELGATFEARLAAAATKARSVFADLGGYFEGTYLPSAAAVDAVGRDRYLRHARRFLGMDIDPEETYAWGWAEVRSILEEMRAAAWEIVPGASIAEVFRVLTTDPARAAHSPEELIRVVRERQERALADLDGKHFSIPSAIRALDVRVAPKGGTLGAYYIPPSEDFSRPGTIWYSLGDQTTIPLFDEITTAYHEGFPGHHLQCGTQVSLRGQLSRFHRLFDGYSGYLEGWALYMEQLMHELGYLDKPDYVFGMLSAQMTRACRVVIDIGCHLDLPIPKGAPFHPGERWSFELATEMLRDVALLSPEVAESEVTRYLGWPGQAISYKVGQRVMLDLRAESRRRLGDAFSLRGFHEKIVGSGPVGLDLLKQLVLD